MAPAVASDCACAQDVAKYWHSYLERSAIPMVQTTYCIQQNHGSGYLKQVLSTARCTMKSEFLSIDTNAATILLTR